MKPSELLQLHRQEIHQISRQFALKNMRVFGSVSKGLDNENSDLDILVEPTEHTTLLDLCGLQMELEELLGIKVDVLTPRSLPEYFRAEVLRDAKPL